MSIASLDTHDVVAFARNVILIGQQSDVRVANAVDNDFEFTEPGKTFTAEFAGERTMRKVTERFAKSPNNVMSRIRRVGHFATFDDGEVLEDRDQAKQLINMSNPVTTGMGLALGRNRDDVVIEAALGTAYEGENGETAVALPAGQKIAVNDWSFHHGAADGDSAPSGNAGLTPAKVRNAKNRLDKSQIVGERSLLVNSDQLNLMLTSKEITNQDYGMVAKIMDGEISKWLGFNWIVTERLPINGSSRSCIAMINSTVQYRARTLKTTRITERPDLSFQWYAYMRAQHGAVRGQDKGVVEILCNES